MHPPRNQTWNLWFTRPAPWELVCLWADEILLYMKLFYVEHNDILSLFCHFFPDTNNKFLCARKMIFIIASKPGADPGWSVKGGVQAKISRKGANFQRFWPILERAAPPRLLLDPPL